MRYLLTLTAALAASPAAAATGPFFSLNNTDFIVLLAFLLFIAVLLYFNVPSKIGEMLDKRASGIQGELDEARTIREEAQSLLASYERKQREVQEQADRIVAQAREDARASAEQAKADLERSIERRLQAAEEQIASAEQAAVTEVRNRAVDIAVAVAREVVAKQMSAEKQSELISSSISTVDQRLN
ncbi:F0F1 ATP synthase subunit B [Roseivivax halodurans JCM 10272]|uniref:ATP synthase subunit b n=1 Tax=Roseivivax halodurans JCM 10272 TaxID=1449350 RepID=X7EJU5_9RHOB|nr:F0F1 ATP synthase subunit B [Roseivivax halodurans]ETX15388.1 F0F1 ATP synthase subunit B [Roseivivax halodurans JCM 10272]